MKFRTRITGIGTAAVERLASRIREAIAQREAELARAPARSPMVGRMTNAGTRSRGGN